MRILNTRKELPIVHKKRLQLISRQNTEFFCLFWTCFVNIWEKTFIALKGEGRKHSKKPSKKFRCSIVFTCHEETRYAIY